MHISEELKKIRATIRKSEPVKEEKFVSVMEPYRDVKPAPKAKEDLSRFELLVFRKNTLPAFTVSNTHEMCFNTQNTEWVKSDIDSLNELLRRFLKFRNDYKRAVIYDNRLPSPYRDERWIFKYDQGRVSVNELHKYADVREKHERDINKIPVVKTPDNDHS